MDEDPPDNSIYPDVRAAVPPTDAEEPASTPRAWLLGVLSTAVSAGFTQLFGLHDPPLALSPYIFLLAALPLGHLLARVLPVGPGRPHVYRPFGVKEHALVAIMAIGSDGFEHGGLATYVWTALETQFGGTEAASPATLLPLGFKLLFLLVTQSLAWGLAGVFQKVVVDPPYCRWPTTLPLCALLHVLHREDRDGCRDGRACPSQHALPQPVGRLSSFSPSSSSSSSSSSSPSPSPSPSPPVIPPPRPSFFWISFSALSAWHLVPGYFFTGLSYFAWVPWIAPTAVLVNQLFGARSGMDLVPLSLNWGEVTAYRCPPQVTSLPAISNVLAGAVLFLWIIGPALHFTNAWYGHYLPFSSASLWDNRGRVYNTSAIVTAASLPTLNATAYAAYSPVYLSTTSALSYGLGFGAVSSVVVHALVYFRAELWDGLVATVRGGHLSHEDIHDRLIYKYPSIPLWWYTTALLAAVGLAFLFVGYYDTGLPWWSVLLALALALVLFSPIAILAATCNQFLSVDAVAALLGGTLWPGHAVAATVFRCLLTTSLGSALFLARNRKLGHYLKVPPRVVFAAQAVGILVNWLVQTGVNVAVVTRVPDVCTAAADARFACPLSNAYAASMVFWGLVGPRRLFASGSLYAPLLWCFPAGAVLPVLCYGASRLSWRPKKSREKPQPENLPKNPDKLKNQNQNQNPSPSPPPPPYYPLRLLSYVNIPLMLSSIGSTPPATAANYITWGLFGIFFQWYLPRHHFAFWHRYNFLLAAALDAGLALSNLFIFLVFSYPGITLNWWGNTVDATTADYKETPLKAVPSGEIFGPLSWE